MSMSEPVQIVADIGGTNARFAYVTPDSDELLGVEVFPCADFPFCVDAIRAYMNRGHVDQVDKICLAVAGPVEADLIDLPNNHWSFSCMELQISLGVSVTIINDFSAQVLCIDALADDAVFLSGGILPRLLNILDEAAFRQRFNSKGRFSEICSKIPLAIVLAEHPGLQGCVQALRKN